jgi:hypothetical protein
VFWVLTATGHVRLADIRLFTKACHETKAGFKAFLVCAALARPLAIKPVHSSLGILIE